MVYGAPKLNLASTNEHVPEIKWKIRVIKEWVRAVIYSIPFNSLPAQMLVHAVLFVTKQLNLFPVKGGLSSKLSPKQIMLGKVVHYCLVWAKKVTLAAICLDISSASFGIRIN